jgi:hypothetical protein
MADNNLEKLLGGFAADTLTEEERTLLYTAALHDQQLFNALADEQALKELLADPAARRRLLQALNQTSASGAGGSPAWLDWFRRPAGLAWAGGLAAAAFAVVIGTKIYQDSLKQAAQSVATEEARPFVPPASAPLASQPASPTVAAPRPKAKLTETPANRVGKPDASLDHVAKQEPASAPAPPPTQADVAATGLVAPTISARSLFYGEAGAHPDSDTIVQEKEQAVKDLSESATQENIRKKRLDRVSQLGRAKGSAAAAKPLGLRYSFVIQESNGLEQEVDAKTAATSVEPVSLTLETNQDAYLQIWEVVGSSPPRLLFPEPDAGQISIKIPVGQRQAIPLPPESGTVSLFVRLSRTPLETNTQLRDRPTLDRLQDSNQARESIALEECATYAVNRDVPSDQLVVHIITR